MVIQIPINEVIYMATGVIMDAWEAFGWSGQGGIKSGKGLLDIHVSFSGQAKINTIQCT